MIRAIPSNASDNVYCTLLAHSAIHGAMAGYTGFCVGQINGRHAYIPFNVSLIPFVYFYQLSVYVSFCSTRNSVIDYGTRWVWVSVCQTLETFKMVYYVKKKKGVLDKRPNYYITSTQGYIWIVSLCFVLVSWGNTHTNSPIYMFAFGSHLMCLCMFSLFFHTFGYIPLT